MTARTKGPVTATGKKADRAKNLARGKFLAQASRKGNGPSRKDKKQDEQSPPDLPRADVDGHYPAAESIQAILARQLYKRRRAAGLTQAQLANAARVRQET